MQAKKEIAKMIIEISGRYSSYEVFYDWIKCSAISINNTCSLIHDKVWKSRENAYISTMKKYTEQERMKMVKMLALLVHALEEEMTDVLGELFMEMKMGNDRAGQFFTPFHVSELNARMSMPEDVLKERKETGELITLNEPSCGGGGAIIAAAKVLKENGINFQSQMRVIAQDLDWKGVYMTYLQCSLLGINGIVVQGDTLVEPYIRGYSRDRIMHTPAALGALI